jgi:hypothetical protein
MTEPKALKDMTWEEAEPIYRALHQGKDIEWRHPDTGKWHDKPNDNTIYGYVIYRIKQIKPSINWDHLRPEMVALAQEKHGSLFVYDSIPYISEEDGIWDTDCECHEVTYLSSAKKGTCDWRESLVIRPGHEQD